MGTHPNAILLLRLKPDDTTRKTYCAILEEAGISTDDTLKIGAHDYNIRVMESEYHEEFQISADEGDIVLFDMVTYGYGDCATWDDVLAQKTALDDWAKGVCERHHCSASFHLTANYW